MSSQYSQVFPDYMNDLLVQICWPLLARHLIRRCFCLLAGAYLGKTSDCLMYDAGFHSSHRGTFKFMNVSDFQLIKRRNVFIIMMLMSFFLNFTYSRFTSYGVYLCTTLRLHRIMTQISSITIKYVFVLMFPILVLLPHSITLAS